MTECPLAPEVSHCVSVPLGLPWPPFWVSRVGGGGRAPRGALGGREVGPALARPGAVLYFVFGARMLWRFPAAAGAQFLSGGCGDWGCEAHSNGALRSLHCSAQLGRGRGGVGVAPGSPSQPGSPGGFPHPRKSGGRGTGAGGRLWAQGLEPGWRGRGPDGSGLAGGQAPPEDCPGGPGGGGRPWVLGGPKSRGGRSDPFRRRAWASKGRVGGDEGLRERLGF